MAETLRLPQDRCQSHESWLGPRPKRRLNPIIEEESDDDRLQHAATAQGQRARGEASHLKIEAWLSPMSDHFPTPRGLHHLAAPVLPSSPSTVSGDDSSPTNSSNPWNRASIGTENTEFEDLYDVSDEESQDVPCGLRRSSSVKRPRVQADGGSPPKPPTRLMIPTSRHSAVGDLKIMTSPVPLTPSTKLHMSPAQVDFMGLQQALQVPPISAPPSLDGSLSSDQLAAMSAPATPVMGDDEVSTDEAWDGVHLQPGALETLHALSSGQDQEHVHEQPEQVLELPQAFSQPGPEMRQQPARLLTNGFPHAAQACASSLSMSRRQSLADLTRLDIPSPGGFFSDLSPRTRRTWHLQAKSPEVLALPNSTTAEQFYRYPWKADVSAPSVPKRSDLAEDFYRSNNSSSAPVEQVIEVRDDDDISDGIPTAKPIAQHKVSSSLEYAAEFSPCPQVQEVPTDVVSEYDPEYARKQQTVALSNLDRTDLWLRAQRAYMRGINGPEDDGLLTTVEGTSEDEDAQDALPVPEPVPEPVVKKAVHFNISPTTVQPKQLPPKLLRQESAYYRAFQGYIVRTQSRDVFVHQLARFEALQAQRAALRESHRNQLLGKYQLSVVPQSAKKRLSANVARGDLDLTDDPKKLRKEKEAEATSQMAMPTWHVAAIKFLNGGRLLCAPVAKRLARVSPTAPRRDGVCRDRARVLDLGGHSTCDWAWHCALQYPNAKVYTVTTKAIRQLSNSNICGPPNHRQVAVERLTRLPFSDDQFDLISARELHSMLKSVGENGEDEWESCLGECMRVLKPGGYLEFSILDSDLMNAGPLGLAKSVEFGFALKTLGYDPSPSKTWLGRLDRAGFRDTRRVWMCLPVGARRKMHTPPTPPIKDCAAGQAAKVRRTGAGVMGGSDGIASVCSIVGSWSWERWLLRCEMEKVAGELRLADTVTTGAAMREAGKCLDGVHAVMEEGRGSRAGFRMLNGYARKPEADSGGLIRIKLAS